MKTIKVIHVISCSYSPALFHNLVYRNLDSLFIPQDITQVHYIDSIMLATPAKQEVAIVLDTLLRYRYARGGK